ncbi:MAG: hypothetical protein ACMX3H_15215 [Sodalis sp. (in: enterobacteria)]|uniref:hypothetical protein n=1 Tax=Sodalis sp. (in: enterobacteria) TaxID=1898979 RepID=UPI0039E55A33
MLATPQPRALNGLLVNTPDLQALNVIVFADHLYLLNAPRCHYQHLSLPCDPQALAMVLDGFFTGDRPAAGAVFPFAPHLFLLTPQG